MIPFLSNIFKPKKKRGVIINFYNDIEYLKHFMNAFPNCTIIPYKEFSPKLIKPYDYIILSGGDVPIHRDKDIPEIKAFLKKTQKPVFGICLGFEILGIVMGGILINSRKSVRQGSRVVEAFKPLFETVLTLDYNHHWYFKSLPHDQHTKERVTEFKTDIVEWLHYKNFYGVQCHPERSGKDGKKIIDKFFEIYKIQNGKK